MVLPTALAVEQQAGQQTIILKFGGGLNTRASPSAIDPTECVDGKNFDLAAGSDFFLRRRAFLKAASVPNSKAIRGYAQLVKSDGSRAVLIQGGDVVYLWNGASGTGGMSIVGNVSASARLRGTLQSNSVKDDKVLIADLALVEPVYQYDGTTFSQLSHNLGGLFKARYITVANERAWYANVLATTALPHVVVASTQNALGTLSTANKPSSSLAAADPFFLNMPDLGRINGLISSLGGMVLSTKDGSFFRLIGANATDHALDVLFANAKAIGDEAFTFIGNDIAYGKIGAIDTISGTNKFGDVDTDDLTWLIGPSVESITSWKFLWSDRYKSLYCFQPNGGDLFVLRRSVWDRSVTAGAPAVSPWLRWTTRDAFNFDATVAMPLLHPIDGLEYPFVGDRSGNLWQLESGGGQDNASNIACERLSKPFIVPPGDIEIIGGYVRAKKLFNTAITLTFEYGGEQTFDRSVSVTLDANANAPVWGGFYWGGGYYWNVAIGARLHRKQFSPAGRGNEVQVRVTIDGAKDFFIEEIGLKVRAA